MADVTSAVELATRVLISQVSRATKRLFTNVCAGQQPPVGAADRAWTRLTDVRRSHSAPGIGYLGGGHDEHRGNELGLGELADIRQRAPGPAGACSRDDGTGCLPSAATIGRKTNLSDRTVPRVIARLEADGHVVVHRGMAASPPPDQRSKTHADHRAGIVPVAAGQVIGSARPS